MLITYDCAIDLKHRGVTPVVHAAQGDVGTRALKIALFSGGTPWAPPAGATAAVAFRRPDGTAGLYDKLSDNTAAVTISGNVVTAMLAPKVMAVSGATNAAVILESGAKQISTFPFRIQVSANPGYGLEKTETDNPTAATATPADLLYGKTADVNGVRITGTHKCDSGGTDLEVGDLSELHFWKKYTPESGGFLETEEADVVLSGYSALGTGNPWEEVSYADEIEVVDGNPSLVNPVTITLDSTTRSTIVGKYIHSNYDGYYYRIPSDATVKYSSSTYTGTITASKAFKLTAADGGELVGLVISEDSAAYPQNGTQDGYLYVYEGTLDDSSGGVELPTLSNPAAAADLASGKELIDQSGNVVTGTLPEVPAGQTLYGNNSPALNWRTDGKIETIGTYGVAGSGAGGIVRPGAKFGVRVPAEQYGDATAADVVRGKTFTSAAGLQVVGTHECEEDSSGGGVAVYGEDDSVVIDTDLDVADENGAIVVRGGNGGVELPALSNPATAADLASGKELIDGAGKVVVGTHKCSYTEGEVHVWKKTEPGTLTLGTGKEADIATWINQDANVSALIEYADEAEIQNGTVVLVNAQSVTYLQSDYDTDVSFLKGKYVKERVSGKVYYLPTNANVYWYKNTSYMNVVSIKCPSAQEVSISAGSTEAGYVASADRNAYPDNGLQDGSQYTYIGSIGGA